MADLAHGCGWRLGQRDQDAPAATKELGKPRLGSRVLGPGDRMTRDKMNPGRYMRPEVADHRLLDRADIGQDGTLF